MSDNETLVNTLKDTADIEYENLEDGNHLCGLVRIKNVELKNSKTGELYKGYQFTFRSMENPNAFVNMKVSASSSEKGRLFKLLRVMTGGKLKKGASTAEKFESMVRLQGHWFNIMTEQSPWTTKSGEKVVFVNVVGEMVLPANDEYQLLGNAIEYFEQKNGELLKEKEHEPLVQNNTKSGAAKLKEKLMANSPDSVT